jgi:hypothetical protein
MTDRAADLKKVRSELRGMSRGNLLIIAERAAEIVPTTELKALLGGFVRIEALAETRPGATSLLDEVREFHAASMSGKYYESFDVNYKNCTEDSKGTDAFIAELDRLLTNCVRAAQKGPRTAVREAFELLLRLLRHIDGGHDDVIFFADEGGSWKVGVDWRTALPAYFRCVAETASAEEFARTVDQAILDFADYERTDHLTAACRVASAVQQAAIRALPPARR